MGWYETVVAFAMSTVPCAASPTSTERDRLAVGVVVVGGDDDRNRGSGRAVTGSSTATGGSSMPLSSGSCSLSSNRHRIARRPGPGDARPSSMVPDSPISGRLASFLRITLIPHGWTAQTRSPRSSTQTRSTFVATVQLGARRARHGDVVEDRRRPPSMRTIAGGTCRTKTPRRRRSPAVGTVDAEPGDRDVSVDSAALDAPRVVVGTEPRAAAARPYLADELTRRHVRWRIDPAAVVERARQVCGRARTARSTRVSTGSVAPIRVPSTRSASSRRPPAVDGPDGAVRRHGRMMPPADLERERFTDEGERGRLDVAAFEHRANRGAPNSRDGRRPLGEAAGAPRAEPAAPIDRLASALVPLRR